MDDTTDAASPPAMSGAAQAALALATTEPEQALVAGAAAEAHARQRRDWRQVSIARRARGVAEIQLRRLDAAVVTLRASVAAAHRAGDAQLAAEANMSLAPALMMRGQPAQGLATVGRAISGLHGVAAARARVQRSAMLQFLGRNDAALADLRAALPILRRDGDAEWEVRALSNRSSIYVDRRQFALAEADLVRTQALCDAHGLGLAGAYAQQNLGCVHMARGDIPAALDCFAGAEDRYRMLGMEVGSLFVDRAVALLRVRLLEESRETVEAAVAALSRQHRAIELPEAQLILSTVALLQGEGDVAIQAAEAAATSLRRLRRTEWMALARYAKLQAQMAPAQDLLAAPTGAPTAPVPSTRIRSVADELEAAGWVVPALEARVLAATTALLEGRKGVARRDLERAAQARRAGPADARVRAWVAEALLREAEGSRAAAKRALRASVRIIDDYRLSLGASELRAHVSVFRSAPSQIGLRLAVEDRDTEAVHWWGERRRASADVMRPALPPKDPTLAALLEELRGIMAEIAEARAEARPTQPLVTRQVQLERSVRDFARRHPLAIAQTLNPASLPDLAAELDETALVEYVDHGGDLVALTMTEGRSRLHHLGSSSEIRHALQHLPFALRRMVRSRDRQPAGAAAVLEHAVDIFERRLVAPIGDLLGARQLLVVPTGWMQGLPWSMLASCRGRPVTVAPSATLWLTARTRRRHDDGSVVAVAGPFLPGALAEAQAVAALYPDATLLQGQDAVSGRVGAAIRSAGLCHIAAHGVVRPDNPLFSSVLLTDGPFTVFDLEQLGATPRQVVLAACESGVSKVTAGQEILGLAAALLERQTATVVAPVVSIDDAETTALMVGYHRRLLAGQTPSQALAAAQTEDVGTGPHARATAAAFICLGVGDVVDALNPGWRAGAYATSEV